MFVLTLDPPRLQLKKAFSINENDEVLCSSDGIFTLNNNVLRQNGKAVSVDADVLLDGRNIVAVKRLRNKISVQKIDFQASCNQITKNKRRKPTKTEMNESTVA